MNELFLFNILILANWGKHIPQFFTCLSGGPFNEMITLAYEVKHSCIYFAFIPDSWVNLGKLLSFGYVICPKEISPISQNG